MTTQSTQTKQNGINNWKEDFRIEAKEIAATLQAGSMIETFKAAIAKAEGRTE